MTGWARGYEHVKRKAWMCPDHGEVGNDDIVLGVLAPSPSPRVWIHLGCGRPVERVTK